MPSCASVAESLLGEAHGKVLISRNLVSRGKHHKRPGTNLSVAADHCVVGLPAGVGTDAVGRTIAEHMKTSLGQPVVFENATGAGGTIGTARAMRAAPDGYTLSLGNLGTHVVSPATYPNIQYHPLNDFEPVALLGTTRVLARCQKCIAAEGPDGIDCVAQSQSRQSIGGDGWHRWD